MGVKSVQAFDAVDMWHLLCAMVSLQGGVVRIPRKLAYKLDKPGFMVKHDETADEIIITLESAHGR